jgi:U3 small nucleolar RNA-associated protein 21
MAMDGDAVWAASGPNVIKYLRGKEVLYFTAILPRNLNSNFLYR